MYMYDVQMKVQSYTNIVPCNPLNNPRSIHGQPPMVNLKREFTKM